MCVLRLYTQKYVTLSNLPKFYGKRPWPKLPLGGTTLATRAKISKFQQNFTVLDIFSVNDAIISSKTCEIYSLDQENGC